MPCGKTYCVDCKKESDQRYLKDNYRKRHPLRGTWKHLKQRCNNPNDDNYHNYGGRGISVCERWLGPDGFQHFLEDMIPTWVKGLELERKDVNGNYEPSNCTWVTHKEQCNNTRRNRLYKSSISQNILTHLNGKLVTLKEFSEVSGLKLAAVKYRYAQRPGDPDWILNNNEDNRFFEYKGHRYNIPELAFIADIKYVTMWHRIVKERWSVSRAVEEPVRNLSKSTAIELPRG